MPARKLVLEITAIVLVVAALYTSSLYNYLLFHSLVEVFTVSVGFVVFLLAWNTRKYVRPGYLKLLGVAYGFICLIDLIHTLAFKGMGVFPGNDANLATQLWIAARYLQALALFLAPLFTLKALSDRVLFPAALAAMALPLGLISTGVFPACYVEGSGLTAFKIVSEYIICAILLASAGLFFRQRKTLVPKVYALIMVSIGFSIAAELSFTSYISVYGPANLLGHLFKLGAFYYLYKALVDVGFKEPYELIFRDLQESGRNLGQTLMERTAQLLESEEKFRAVFEASPLGKALISPRGTILEVNPAFGQILGYTVEELKQKTLIALTHPEDVDASWAEFRALADGEKSPRRFEKRYLHRDGHAVWTEVNTALHRDDSGEILYFISSVSDISDRKRHEAEREQLSLQLNQAQKMEAVGLLAGGVAHDFNNMLGVIMGRVQIAQSQVDPGHAVSRQLKEISRAAERSADLTRQLLAFARKQPITPRILDLNATLESSLELLSRLIGETIAMEWRPSAEPLNVRLDPGQVNQLLANLCVNARDAIQSGQKGNGRIRIETRREELTEALVGRTPGGRPGSYAVVSVTDDGQGMGPETLARIFEPFFTTKELGQGTGLGLATVYGIVHQNHGFLSVSSKLGQGTTFDLYFPLLSDPVAPTVEPLRETLPLFTGKTALLVEDEAMLLEVVGAMLGELGLTVESASNADQALEKAGGQARPFDLLVTDLVLPGMSGQELARRLSRPGTDLRVLFISGYTADVVQFPGLRSVFLQKPFTSGQFAEKVGQILA